LEEAEISNIVGKKAERQMHRLFSKNIYENYGIYHAVLPALAVDSQ